MTPEKTKPFPWRCPNCAKKAVQAATIRHYSAEIKHDGRLHSVEVSELEAAKCEACGDIVLDATSDVQIVRALRQKLALLQPEQIRERREALGLTQRKLAERLGVAAETISRWESGTLIQSRAMDNLLRLFFEFENVREALQEDGPQPELGRALDKPAPIAASDWTQGLRRWVKEISHEGASEEGHRLLRTLQCHSDDLIHVFTTATELCAARPTAFRSLAESLTSARCRVLDAPGHVWMVVNLCHSEPRTNRLAARLQEVAEEVEEAPEHKTEKFFAIVRQQARLMLEK